jgi:hypothetical protein
LRLLEHLIPELANIIRLILGEPCHQFDERRCEVHFGEHHDSDHLVPPEINVALLVLDPNSRDVDGRNMIMMYRHSRISGLSQPKEARVATVKMGTVVADHVPLDERV